LIVVQIDEFANGPWPRQYLPDPHDVALAQPEQHARKRKTAPRVSVTSSLADDRARRRHARSWNAFNRVTLKHDIAGARNYAVRPT